MAPPLQWFQLIHRFFGLIWFDLVGFSRSALARPDLEGAHFTLRHGVL
jgi:hypothetical protein